MTEGENSKRYDLEERTCEFARRVRLLINLLNKTLANIEDAKQVIRASGFVASNFKSARMVVSNFEFSSFGFVSDFEIRISDLGYAALRNVRAGLAWIFPRWQLLESSRNSREAGVDLV